MERIPYVFTCARCGGLARAEHCAAPAADGCGDGPHAWRVEHDARRYALHEAGHAVAAAIAFGVPAVDSAMIRKPAQSRVLYTGRPNSPEAMLVALAGPAVAGIVGDPDDGTAGDLRSFSANAFGWLLAGAGADEDQAPRLAALLPECREMFERCALEFVRERETSIEAFARELLVHRELSGTELHATLDRAIASRADGSRLRLPGDLERRQLLARATSGRAPSG